MEPNDTRGIGDLKWHLQPASQEPYLSPAGQWVDAHPIKADIGAGALLLSMGLSYYPLQLILAFASKSL